MHLTMSFVHTQCRDSENSGNDSETSKEMTVTRMSSYS